MARYSFSNIYIYFILHARTCKDNKQNKFIFLQTCFKNFEQCASAEEIQISRDRFLIKEYLSASLYSDLFPTLLTCSPTVVSFNLKRIRKLSSTYILLNSNNAFQELLASNRYGSIEKQGSGIGCSGFASFNTQLECVKQIVPKMVDEQRKVPMRRNSRFAAADPDKLQGLNTI